jgi:Tfp pilus assembly protein PilV
MRDRHRLPDRDAVTPRGGTTLVELLVALVLLAVGALALAATGALAAREGVRGSARAEAALAGLSRLESLAATPCSALAQGAAADSTRGLAERWTVSGGRGWRATSDSVRRRAGGVVRVVVLRGSARCP